MSALFVAWRGGDAQHGTWGPVGRLDRVDGTYRFCYTRGARTLAEFRPLTGMDDLEQVYESEALFPVFANRLLSPSRPEYEAFLTWGGFDSANPPDPIAILAVTEGIRQTDEIEVFPCPAPDGDGCYLNKFFLHGIRWMMPAAVERIARLAPNEPLYMMPDPCNIADPFAVAVRTAAPVAQIGYVPRYLAHDVGQLLHRCDPEFIELFVQRVNPDAPMQQRVLCRMHACWPDDFVPCSGEAFQPIPAGVPSHCEA
jgi:hypothetical protein